MSTSTTSIGPDRNYLDRAERRSDLIKVRHDLELSGDVVLQYYDSERDWQPGGMG